MFKVIALYDKKQPLPNDDIYYIITKKGILLRKKVGLIDALVPVDKISFLENEKPYINLDLPKISYSLFSKIVSFLKTVFEKYKTESVVMLYLDRQTREYYIHVPEQEVTRASIKYERNISFTDKLLVGTIHSHSDFRAFHSGVDISDEKTMDGLHITVGKLNDDYYHEVVCSVVCNGHRIKKNPSEYINIKAKANKKFFIAPKKFPIYWLDMINYNEMINSKDCEQFYGYGFYDDVFPFYGYGYMGDISENYSENKKVITKNENIIESKNKNNLMINSIREKYLSKIESEELNGKSFMQVYNSIEDSEKTYLEDHICKDCKYKGICITKCSYFKSLALRNYIQKKYGKGDIIEKL